MFRSKKQKSISDLRRVTLRADHVYLRAAIASDEKEWLALRAKNQSFLKPYEPAWPQDATTPALFRRRLIRVNADWDDDRAYSFLIFTHDNKMVGGLNINNVTRGAAQYATIGYWIDEDHQGRGLMKEALQLGLGFAFEILLLARINAAALPHNERSRRLLSALGFVEEGFARGYIQIDGKRADHILYGLNAVDFKF